MRARVCAIYAALMVRSSRRCPTLARMGTCGCVWVCGLGGRKLKIPITTFMIASDPHLRRFVELFTAQNNGKAFLTGLKGLGQMIFEDYEKNRIKRI